MEARNVVVVTFCAIAVILVLGLVFYRPFRSLVIKGTPGEATLFGIVTVKGAHIIVLCGIFAVAAIYALPKKNEKCGDALSELKAKIDDKQTYEVDNVINLSDRTNLGIIVAKLQTLVKIAKESCH
jgi:hypothetical protein